MAPTAIVVPVPEAAPAVDRWRRRYTQAARGGLPPHVTLLFPFVDDDGLEQDDVAAVHGVLAGFAAVELELRVFGPPLSSPSTGAVLYLAPEPAAPFAAMTQALAAAFPDYPPYGGEFAEVVPHLTVALGDDAPAEEIRADVERHLPIRAHAAEAWLAGRDDDRWLPRSRIRLAG